MLYDTHCHPYLAKEKTQNEVIANFLSQWWKFLNTVSVDMQSSQLNVALAQENTWVFAVIWIHPTHVLDYIDNVEEVIKTLETLYKNNSQNVVALWETWLDYYWLEKLSTNSWISEKKIKEIQKEFFIAHIALAKKLWLPIVIHNRESANDVFEILRNENFTNFIFHCYSEDLDYALELIKFAPECKLGFWWVLTFKSAQKTRDAAIWIPLKNIIIETDSPYLTPSPHRGKIENEPAFTIHVLDMLQHIRPEDDNVIKKIVFQNSLEIFNIKKETA